MEPGLDFFERVDRAHVLLARYGRVTRRALQRTFDDPELVDEIADELIVQGVAAWDGDVLVMSEAARPAAATPADEGRPRAGDISADAQIRHLTVLFCDVVGSTELSTRVGAEAWTGAMRAVLAMAADAVRTWRGHVGGYLGDGLLAYFGYPVALENAGERAVRAGLSIVGGLAEVNTLLRELVGEDVAVRVGIHTGPVVVDELDGWFSGSGLTTNVAARVQSEAPPNSVVITETTQRLVSGVFVTDDLGAHDLKGVAEPMRLRRVRGVAAPSPLTSPARRATRFMGRESELSRFVARWERARSGAGQVVVVGGDAGLGKSRLIEEFRRSLAMAPHTWLEARGSPFATSVPLDPVVELVRRSLSLTETASPDEAERAVRQAIGSLDLGGLAPDDGVAVVRDFLGLTSPASVPADAELRRFQLLDLLVDWVARTAAVQPTVLYVDDYHWVDPSTQQLIERCCERAVTIPLLVVVAARPDGRPGWSGDHIERIDLPPLPAEGLAEIARHVAGPELAERLIEAIVSRAEGVPLFAEEITAAMIGGDSGEITIPDSIENLLMSRLERHPGLRDLAQVASVIGTEFRLDELAHLVDLPSVMSTLAAGVRAGVFVHSDDGAVQTYSFRHALSRDAAYGSMVSPTRRAHHLRFARGLEQGRGQVVERRPDLVAEHFALGGERAAASAWWRRAGDRAHQGAAYPEATRFYELALEAAPEDDEPSLIELNLLLAGSIAASRGATHPTSVPLWREVLRLAEQLDDRRSIAIGLMGAAGGHLARGGFDQQAQLMERARPIVEELDDPALHRIHVTGVMANALFSGEPQRAIAVAEHADAAGWRSSPWLDLVFGIPADPWTEAVYAYALAAVGRFDDAVVVVRRVESAASELGLGPSTVLLPLIRTVDALAGNIVRYAALSEEYYERAVRFRLGTNIAFSRVFALVTRCTLNPSPDLLAEVHEAVGLMAKSGQLMSAPFMAWMLAGAELACDRHDLAEATCAFGQAIAEQTGQHWYDGQLHARRLRAQAAIGNLPDDWEHQARTVLDFTRSRTLRVGALHVAMAMLDLRRGTAGEAESVATLEALVDDLPDSSDTPLRQAAIAALGRAQSLKRSSRSVM